MTTEITIRLLAADESVAPLTALVHRAYAALGARGWNFNGVDQAEEVTRQRVRMGLCFVATAGDAVVGTILVHGPFASAPAATITRSDVAYFQQFAVDPLWQRSGLGSQLLAQAEACAAQAGYAFLSTDTAVEAAQLLAYYHRRGYVPVEEYQWPGKTYRSVVLAKPLVAVPDVAASGDSLNSGAIPRTYGNHQEQP